MKPIINIHNYEEFFLLYVDGELSAEDKLAVDHFVQYNPHLATELEMLKQTLLDNDELCFDDKELLYRNGAAEINIENAETHFLLYVDNELDAAGRNEVETFVLQHPSLQEPFLQLKQARLVPETVVFPDKASLYRKEEKERRVLYMRWQRVAVAAAMIGLVVLAGRLIPSGDIAPAAVTAYNQPAVTDKTAATTQSPVKQLPQQEITEKTPAIAAVDIKQETRGSLQAVDRSRETAGIAAADQVPDRNVFNEQTQAVHNEPPANVITAQRTTTNEAAPVTFIQPKTQVAANNQTASQQTELIPAINTQPDDAMAMTAQPAVYRELDTEEGDDKKSLYVGSIEINKDKLRGFFRKATSLFRGKAKEEERTENTPSHSRSLR